MAKYYNEKYMNFSLYPESRIICNFTLEETKEILDFIAMRLNTIINRSEMSNIKSIIMSPFHCLVMETENYIVYGVSNENCIINYGIILCSTLVFSDESIESVMKNCSKKEAGFRVNNFIWIKKDIVNKFKPLLTKLASYDDVDEKTAEFMKIENEELRLEFIRSTDDFFAKLVEEESRLNINPVFKARNLTIDEKLCFCVLPFDDERLEIFNDIIKPELEKDFGLTIIRADNIFSNNDIMEDIWTYICKSRFVIADVSLKNPNVFYELGICHTIGKEVITICDESSLQDDYNGKLPFDIQSRRTIFYKNSGSGPKKMVEDLKNTVRSIIDGKTVLI